MAERFLDQLKVGMWPESGYNVYLPPEIHRQSLYALGLSGCLHPDTPIFDPVDATTKTVFQRFIEGRTFHVVALDGSNTPIIAEAEAPKQYPKTKMYRVSFDNGESITVTGGHRLFVGTGYASVAQLLFSYKQTLSGVGIRLPSIPDNDLLVSLSGVPAGTTQCQILSIEAGGEEKYYDFHVPIYENYWACGVFHHNTGKSTLLGNLALQWSAMGEGVLVIDVKDGRLARDLAKRANPDKLIYVAPGLCYFDGHPHHWALNVLEPPVRNRFGFEVVKSNVISMFERMARADYSVMVQVRRRLDFAVRLANYERDATLVTVYDVLTKQSYRHDLIARTQRRGIAINQIVLDHWEQFDDPKMMNTYARYQALNSTLARLEEIVAPEGLYYLVSQPTSSITLGPWLMAGKLVIVDCASGQMTEENAELFGNLILAQAMHVVGLRRPETYLDDEEGNEPAGPFMRIICDEADLLAGNNFAKLITKARSFKTLPVLAHQNRSQMAGRDRDDRLLNALSGVYVEFDFTLTDQDQAQMARLRPGQEDEEIEAFTARLRLRRKGLPMGLLDAGKSALIRLSDWVEPVILGQYARAVASQQALTTPERVLRSRTTMEATHHDHPSTPPPPRPNPPQSRASRQTSAKPGDDSGVAESLGDAGQIPDPPAVAAGQAPLSGSVFKRGRNRSQRGSGPDDR